MNNDLLKNIIRIVLLFTVQVLFLNNIQLYGLYTPYLYILIILLLPVSTPKWLTLVFAFFTGLGIDLFDNTIGIHAFSLVFATFFRPAVLQVLSPFDGYDLHKDLLPREYGFLWFIKYSFSLVLIHQLVLYFIDAFSFANTGIILGRWLINSTFTEAILIITVFGFEKRK